MGGYNISRTVGLFTGLSKLQSLKVFEFLLSWAQVSARVLCAKCHSLIVLLGVSIQIQRVQSSDCLNWLSVSFWNPLLGQWTPRLGVNMFWQTLNFQGQSTASLGLVGLVENMV